MDELSEPFRSEENDLKGSKSVCDLAGKLIHAEEERRKQEEESKLQAELFQHLVCKRTRKPIAGELQITEKSKGDNDLSRTHD